MKDDVALYILSGLFAIFFLVLRCFYLDLYDDYFAREDGFVEYSTALWFLLASVFAFMLARGLDQSKKMQLSRILSYVISMLFLVAALEEISWGQRLIGIDTPEFVEQINTHKEINIHNLKPVQSMLDYLYLLAGVYGMFSGLLYDLLVKKTRINRVEDSKWHHFDLLIVPPRYAIFFVPVFVDSIVWVYRYEYEWASWIRQPDEEYSEFFFAWGWFLSIRHRFKVRKNQLSR